ncbi:hypothetical protein CDAR_8621 [Caerostris darwini]|uniref:Uncharacterized protein n=1 Tax=Caerostris darwini TaxID=1538125 RepID=A0AAV4R321_9ARAC|nr:hypothetical protein CDAR_8621 [Caerostris darwini]
MWTPPSFNCSVVRLTLRHKCVGSHAIAGLLFKNGHPMGHTQTRNPERKRRKGCSCVSFDPSVVRGVVCLSGGVMSRLLPKNSILFEEIPLKILGQGFDRADWHGKPKIKRLNLPVLLFNTSQIEYFRTRRRRLF